MEQQTAPVIRGRKHKPYRWNTQEKEKAWQTRLRQSVEIAGQMLAPFLLGFADFMDIPSGLQAAYLGALASIGESMLWPVCGCLLSLLMRAVWGLPLRLPGLLAWGIMALSPQLLFHKGVGRLMLVTGLALLPGLVVTITGGLTADILLGVASVLMAVFLAPVCSRALQAWGQGGLLTQTEDRLSICFLVGMLLCGASRMSFFGLQLGVLGAAFLTAGAGMYLGAGAGTLLGLMSGTAIAAQGYPLNLAVCLALGGFFAGLTRRQERSWLSGAAFAVGCGTTMLVAGGMSAGSVAGALMGAAVLALFPRQERKRLRDCYQRFAETRRCAEDQYAALLLTRWERTMKEMAELVPSPMTDMPPHDAAWWKARLCAGCPLEDDCRCMEDGQCIARAEQVWSLREAEDADFLRAMEELRGMGCARLYLMREKMVALRREDMLTKAASLRAAHERNMVCTHLTAAASAARSFAEKAAGEDWWEAMMIRRIRGALGECSFPAELLFARRVEGRACLGFREVRTLPLGDMDAQLRKLMREEINLELEPARQEDGVLIFEESPLWRLETGQAARALAENEEGTGNGDAILTLRLPDGRYLAAISDGMGHGVRAHEESTRTLALLRLCLQAGYTVGQALTAVNGMMLCATQGEQYATVDLLLADLWHGRAELHKLGASASVLIRGGKGTTLDSAALPLGIVEEVEPLSTEFRLEDGQTLFLMTDGMAEVLGDEEQTRRACEQAAQEAGVESAAAMLMQLALEAGGKTLADDASCAAVRFTRKAGF